MSKISKFFNSLREGLFGGSKSDDGREGPAPNEHVEFEPRAKLRRAQAPKRDPYHFQIGYDFGTSFSKCVYREVYKDKAWVFRPGYYNDKEKPFLIPSTIIYQNGNLSRHIDSQVQYPDNGLYHLKFAIEKIACGEPQAPVLNPYKAALNGAGNIGVDEFVENCAIFFLGSSLSEIQQEVKKMFPDFGDDPADQFAVNMAIPVADASVPEVRKMYERILKKAWTVAPTLGCDSEVNLDTFASMIDGASSSMDDGALDDLCFVYPEVSANVQAFIRSPASSPKKETIYFFTDTGAGTVDQSVFTYTQKLNYFSANVLPLGSSHIERLACDSNISTEQLEYWRNKKEVRDDAPNLIRAQNTIEEELARYSYSRTIAETKERLYLGEGVDPVSTIKRHIRFLFGGGGLQDFPYKKGVFEAFEKLFHPDKFRPVTTEMRTPEDLELAPHQKSWMSRLYVAYGLSFLRADLISNKYPDKTALSPNERKMQQRVDCSCRGITPDCLRCSGRGWYYE